MDPPRSLIELHLKAQSPHRNPGALHNDFTLSHLGTAWLVVPDLKANQTNEGQTPEDKPAQSSDPYDKK
jgi:hypothetical protein